MSDRIYILGVPIDPVTMDEAVSRITGFLQSDGHRPTSALGATAGRHVMTPNNEMLVEAQKNPAFLGLLQKSDLSLPDSSGLLLAAKWKGQRLPQRVTGVDTVRRLCASLSHEHPVFLLGAAEGVAERAAAKLREKNSQLNIAGTYSGSPRPEHASEIIDRINRSGVHVLLVAFGASVQDLWIAEHLHQVPSVRVAMGVGGTFDFIAGVKKRAPRFIQNIGLEWFWRFVQEPSRWKRMWRAVVVFPLLVLRHGKTEVV